MWEKYKRHSEAPTHQAGQEATGQTPHDPGSLRSCRAGQRRTDKGGDKGMCALGQEAQEQTRMSAAHRPLTRELRGTMKVRQRPQQTVLKNLDIHKLK